MYVYYDIVEDVARSKYLYTNIYIYINKYERFRFI